MLWSFIWNFSQNLFTLNKLFFFVFGVILLYYVSLKNRNIQHFWLLVYYIISSIFLFFIFFKKAILIFLFFTLLLQKEPIVIKDPNELISIFFEFSFWLTFIFLIPFCIYIIKNIFIFFITKNEFKFLLFSLFLFYSNIILCLIIIEKDLFSANWDIITSAFNNLIIFQPEIELYIRWFQGDFLDLFFIYCCINLFILFNLYKNNWWIFKEQIQLLIFVITSVIYLYYFGGDSNFLDFFIFFINFIIFQCFFIFLRFFFIINKYKI